MHGHRYGHPEISDIAKPSGENPDRASPPDMHNSRSKIGAGARTGSLTPEMFPLLHHFDQQHLDSILRVVPGGASNVQDIYPLSPLQNGMLFHHLLNEQRDGYVLSTLIELPTQSQVKRLIRAIQHVIDRHDILRAAVHWKDLPQPIQVVMHKASLPVEYLELDRETDPIEQISKRVQAGIDKIDVANAPMVKLLITTHTNHLQRHAVLYVHHLTCDNQSLGLIVDEAMAFLDGRGNELRPTESLGKLIVYTTESDHARNAEAFFRSRLAKVEDTTAPYGLLNVHGDGSQIRESRRNLSSTLAHQVRIQAKRFRTTPARLFHAAWALVVAHTSGRDDVVFGTVLLSSAHHVVTASGKSLIGPSINTLPLRFALHNLTAKGLLEQVDAELRELRKHDAAPLSMAQRCSGMKGTAPLFTSLLNFRRGASQPDAHSLDGIRVLRRFGARTNYPVTMSVNDLGIEFELTAHTDQIESSRVIDALETSMHSLTQALEQSPDRLALTLPTLPASEYHQVIELFNPARTNNPTSRSVHERFEEELRRAPQATAVVYEDESITYFELNHAANQLARYLQSCGAVPGDYVPVVMARSPLMLTAQLAILKSGCVYVPIDPELPAERQAFVLRDCRARVVLSDRKAATDLGDDVTWVNCQEAAAAIAERSGENMVLETPAVLPAYVMYTSGSTGIPKGVVVPHHAITALVVNNDYATIGRDDCLLHYSNPSFDASTFEIWGALLNGARVVILPQSAVLDAHIFAGVIKHQKVTLLYMSVGLFNQYVDVIAESLTQLRYLMIGGDSLEPNAIRRLLETNPPQHLLNAYGPTECTTFSTLHLIRTVAPDAAGIPIGAPVANARAYILDAHQHPCPIGVIGELFVGGDRVACGYLNRPQITSERFLPDPFSQNSPAIMYKTGDLCRWRCDGAIEHLGRNDSQVKIRGFRVELGDIEAHVTRHPCVKEAVVVVAQDKSGEKRLIAYVATSDPALTADELRMHLRAALPEYMVPSALVVLEHLPLNANGKVDRRALPKPDLSAYARDDYQPPEGEIEETIAGIFCDVLGVEHVGRHDDFFELGGHSLLVLSALVAINKSLGGSLKIKDLYNHPKVRELADRISSGAGRHAFVDLKREAVLDPAIVAGSPPRQTPAENILLTGGSGFVGRFLIAQLVMDTEATIYCMVRAGSSAEASERIKHTLVKWDLWQDDFERRLVAIPGDLSKPRLGLDAATYQLMADTVDTIYHCATSMNHLETYSMARPANVEGSVELLRIAARRRTKLVNFVSTVSIFRPTGERRAVNEQTRIDGEQHRSENGYGASKWVAEKLFILAREREIPCNIFRLGLIWADTQKGRYDELQRIYRIFKSCLLSGYGIRDFHHDMPPTPVDYASRAIVTLAAANPNGGGIFHISADKQMNEGVFERCNVVADTDLEIVSFYEWVMNMRRLHEAGHQLPVTPLIEFAFDMNEQSFMEHQQTAKANRVVFECASTHQELERHGIFAPALDDTALRRYVTTMLNMDPDLSQVAEQRARRQRGLKTTYKLG